MCENSNVKWYMIDYIYWGINLPNLCYITIYNNGCPLPVVDCDLKPNNILLNKYMVAHVSDFGISKLLGDEDSITQTITLATIGDMAPGEVSSL